MKSTILRWGRLRFFAFFAFVGLGWAVAPMARAGEDDAPLRRVLSLLGTLHIGDDYAAVKKLLPEIGELRKDAGDDNTEALARIKIGKVVLRGEFNFSHGHLVSHGFQSGELTLAQAHAFLLRCMAIMTPLYGESQRRVELPTETDGPVDQIGISFEWHKDKVAFAIDFHLKPDSAGISWGAQGE